MEVFSKRPPEQSTMRKVIVLFLIFLFGSIGSGNSGDLNNLSIIDSLIISAIQEDIESLKADNADSLAIDVSEIDWEKGNYLKMLIGNLAIKNSFRVFRNYNSTSSFQGLVLTVNRLETKIEYSKPYEKSFLGKNYITRRIGLKIRGQFYSARTDEIKRVIEKDKEYTDDLPYTNIDEIENSAYRFSKGQREDYSFWEKIYEPVLVIASVGVVVYLFFTQRT